MCAGFARRTNGGVGARACRAKAKHGAGGIAGAIAGRRQREPRRQSRGQAGRVARGIASCLTVSRASRGGQARDSGR